MPKVTKSGEQNSAFIPNERKRKKPLTPEERTRIINRFENIKEISNIHQTERKWLEKETDQQNQDLTYDPIIVGLSKPQEITKNNRIKELISDLFCSHDKCIIKDGYRICPDCKSKWNVENKVGTTKSK